MKKAIAIVLLAGAGAVQAAAVVDTNSTVTGSYISSDLAKGYGADLLVTMPLGSWGGLGYHQGKSEFERRSDSIAGSEVRKGWSIFIGSAEGGRFGVDFTEAEVSYEDPAVASFNRDIRTDFMELYSGDLTLRYSLARSDSSNPAADGEERAWDVFWYPAVDWRFGWREVNREEERARGFSLTHRPAWLGGNLDFSVTWLGSDQDEAYGFELSYGLNKRGDLKTRDRNF